MSNITAATAMASHRKTIVAMSLLFLVGNIFFWLLDPPNWAVFFGTISVVALGTGFLLGYHCQGLTAVRPTTLAYPISWRIGCVWVVVAAMAEFFLTDLTISYTLNSLSPFIFIGTGLMALAFLAGSLVRKAMTGLGQVGMKPHEWAQLIAAIVGAISLPVYVLSNPRTELQPNKIENIDGIDFGDNSSLWSNDGECDDPRFDGDGMAISLTDENQGRDATDCQQLYSAGRIRLAPTPDRE